MSYWDGKKIISIPTKICEEYPNWLEIDCGCSGGLQWGGEEPIECRTCGGTGRYFVHIKSRVIAIYPGGPLLGSYDKRSMLKELISLQPSQFVKLHIQLEEYQ